MDNDNTPLKTIKLEVPSTPHHDDLAKSLASPELAEYDYFIPVLAVDVWPTILNYVTEKKDLESAMNTCQLFHDILQPRAFTELILPLLFLKHKLCRQSQLVCRGINQYTKSALETTMFDFFTPRYKPNVVWFSDLDVYIRGRLRNIPSNVNPFVCKRAETHASSAAELRNILVLFKNYGTNLTRLYLSVNLPNDADRELAPKLQMLLQVLGSTPNLQALSLNLRNFHPVPVANDEDPFPPLIFPMLNNLSELKICIYNSMHTPRYISPLILQFLKNLFQTYGPHLDSFSCGNSILNIGISADFFSSTFPNIKQFDMIATPSINTLATMAQFKFPMLELVKLQPMPFRIPFSPALLRMLENFGDSLKEICCEDFEQIELDQFVIENLKPLSKITKLTVYWRCNDTTALWSVLHVVLPNLRCLRLQPNGRREEAPLPDYNRRQAYFDMFPQLEKLMWCIYGKEMSYIEKTFVRNMQLPVCKYYEVPRPGYEF